MHFLLPSDGAHAISHLVQLFPDTLSGNLAHIRMAPGMVANQMPLLRHTLKEFRLGFDVMTRHKKWLALAFLSAHQNSAGIPLLIPIIERQEQFFDC